jgi:tRNA threonylcarbamoyladenosine biosynthesis protein TsaE
MNLTYKLSDIKAATDKVWQAGKNSKVWAFHAEMGGGKTTFIHALCEMLGVSSAIGSPTYSIINEYNSTAAGIIYHMDWYRMKDEEEALQAGVEDCIYSGSVCFIEWPERAEKLLPENTFHINIAVQDEQTRVISF